MSGSTTCYGPSGQQAGGDQKVAELLRRSVNGQYEALTSFDETLSNIQSNGRVPWTAPLVELTLLNYQWLTLTAWERATVFLDAIVTTSGLDEVGYRQLDMLCDQASQASLKTIGLIAEVTQGKKPGLRQPERVPLPPLTKHNCDALWVIIEGAFVKVHIDLERINKFGIPAGMQKVHKLLEDTLGLKTPVFNHLQSEWQSASSTDNRMQTVREALPLFDQFYMVGQQLWTPYMLGAVYTDIVRSTATFDRLKLGFDPWILTDPAVAETKVTDVQSCRELANFWETIADPSAAHALQTDVTQLVRTGQLAIQPGKTYRVAPWHPHYVAHSSVSVDGRDFQSGDLFTVYPRGSAGQRSLEIRPAGRA